MHTISNFYLGLDTPYPPPSFIKPHFPLPTDEDIKEYLPHMLHLKHTYPVAELGARYGRMNKGVVRVDVRIPGHKLREMQRRANERLERTREQEGDRQGGSINDIVKLSRQDVLTARIVMALNTVLEKPIETLTNAASVSYFPDNIALELTLDAFTLLSVSQPWGSICGPKPRRKRDIHREPLSLLSNSLSRI